MAEQTTNRKRHAPDHSSDEENSGTFESAQSTAFDEITADVHLLQFYKESLDKLENERQEWLSQLEECKIAPAQAVC